jgi:hypothetical protein
MQVSKSELVREIFKRMCVGLLMLLPPDLCLFFLVKPVTSTQILLFVLLQGFIGFYATLLTLLLLPVDDFRVRWQARDQKTGQVST